MHCCGNFVHDAPLWVALFLSSPFFVAFAARLRAKLWLRTNYARSNEGPKSWSDVPPVVHVKIERSCDCDKKPKGDT